MLLCKRATPGSIRRHTMVTKEHGWVLPNHCDLTTADGTVLGHKLLLCHTPPSCGHMWEFLPGCLACLSPNKGERPMRKQTHLVMLLFSKLQAVCELSQNLASRSG